MSGRFVRDHIEAILIAVLIALVLRIFVISAYKIPSESMAPSLVAGDFIFGYKLPFGLRLPIIGTKIGEPSVPKRGEAIIFQMRDENSDNLTYVKRVIALPGDRVEMKAGVVYINDAALVHKFDRKFSLGGKELNVLVETLMGVHYRVLMPSDPGPLTIAPIVVPPKHVFVLADNRISGDDSRNFGPVPLSQIEARVSVIWLSLQWYENRFFPGLRWERVFSRVH